MRVKVLATMAAAAAAGSVLLASSPASAYPNWQSWVRTSSTVCGPTTASTVSNYVINQTCIIKNPDNGTKQSVLLVRNNASVDITIDKATTYWVDLDGSAWGSADCGTTVVVPGELTACYGESVWDAEGRYAHGRYLYNSVWNNAAEVSYP